MFNWRQIEETVIQIIKTAIRFVKARRREEGAITAGALLIWAGIYFPEWLDNAGVKDFFASWRGDAIGRSILTALGAGLVLYAAIKIFRLVYVPDLPPPQDRPSAIKGPMAFTEDDGALFRKLGRENDLQKLLGLILDNQVGMVVVRGASGAGKTSFLRAGLTHILAEKGVKYHYWEAAPTEPDKWLLHAIRETWSDDTTEPAALDELINPSDKLCRQAHVIVLDQFEQLRGSKSIFRLLRRIAREAKPPHRVTWVIAFREEFSKDWMDFIWPELERGSPPPRDLPLRLFTPDQAREVISQLVSESYISVEQSVVDSLVEAATVEGEVSPVDVGIGLLALAEMSERRGGKTVTIRDYQFAGGAEGLLTQYIGRCMELFAKEDRETILKAMLAMRDAEGRQRIAEGLGIDELAKEAGAEARLLKPMLDRLAQRDVRLLEIVTTPNEPAPRYRLPHERLIPALHRLTGRLLAEVDQARLKFEDAFLAWQKNGGRSRYLMKGSDLRLVKRFETKIPWGANAQEKQSFLSRSTRRRRFVRAATVAAGLALIGLGWVAIQQYQRFDDRRFLSDSGYPPLLYDWQHQLRRLALTEGINLERFRWLSSDSIEELELHASGSSNSIAGLASLSVCRSLKKLTLSLRDSQVSDLGPLAELSNLTQLTFDLNDSKVSDLGPLAELSNLTHLTIGLDNSGVSDLGPLAKLGNLTQLTLNLGRVHGSEVRDLVPLAELSNLTHLTLDLGHSKVRDLGQLAKLGNLTQLTLGLRDSEVSSLEPLSKLRNLTQLALDIGYYEESDLESLAKLSNLTQLTLHPYRKVSDLEPIAELSNRTQLTLDLVHSGVSDLGPLAKMGKLTQLMLYLRDSEVSSLEPLSKMSNLTQLALELHDSKVSSLEPLSKLRNLTRLVLYLGNREVSSLELLSNLRNLTQLELSLGSSGVSSVEPLADLSNLTQLALDLSYTNMSELEPLAKLRNLAQLTLELRGYKVSDWGPLAKLRNLAQLTLDLRDNKVSDWGPLAELSNLTQLTLDLSGSEVSDLGPLPKLSNLTRLALNLFDSKVSDLEPLSRLMRLRTLSVDSPTRAQRMSLRNIPASLVELKF
jgi:internalin A